MTTGSGSTSATENTGLGYNALLLTTSGSNNIGVGSDAAHSNTTGHDNTVIGREALYNNTTGANNVAIGSGAGYNGSVSLTTMGNSTFIGTGANSSTNGITNSTALGYNAQVTASNQIVFGNTSVTSNIFNGNVTLANIGNGISIKEGTNAAMGIGTLSGGTLVISNTRVTANSRIFLTDQGGTVTNLGSLYISARTAGTSFTVSSSNVLDASTFAWVILEPAP